MNTYDIIGKKVRLNNRLSTVEDVIGKKAILKDEYGIEFEEDLNIIINAKEPIEKELIKIKINPSGTAMVFYKEGEDIKHIILNPNNLTELEEAIEKEDISYNGDLISYNEEGDREIEFNDSIDLSEADLNKIKHIICKKGYNLIKDEDNKLEFESKKKLDTSILSASQIELSTYNENLKIEDIMDEIEDKFSIILNFDLYLNNYGNFIIKLNLN